MNDLLDNRPRRIVKLAAGLVKSNVPKYWLEWDEKGIWELKAKELLEDTAEAVREKGLTPEQVDKELAEYLGYLALTAALAVAKKEKANALAARQVRADRRGRRARR
jgi:hypothetical protein